MERAGGLMTDGFGHNRAMPRMVVTIGAMNAKILEIASVLNSLKI